MTQLYQLTLQDIKEIYNAGCSRGINEASAHEWGTRATGNYYDELEYALYELFNKGIEFDNPKYQTLEQIGKLFNETNIKNT